MRNIMGFFEDPFITVQVDYGSTCAYTWREDYIVHTRYRNYEVAKDLSDLNSITKELVRLHKEDG